MAAEMGLSPRGAANVDAILPRISAAVEERSKKENTNIDLGTSENWLLRNEIVSICKEAVQQYLGPKQLSYPDGFGGDSALLEALSGLFNRHFQPASPVIPSHLATAPGAAASLDALLYNICEAGSGVLVPAPFWNGFDWLFNVRSGVHPVPVNVERIEDTFTSALIPSLSDALANSTRPIKAVVLTNPHNPFGQCYPRAVLEECIKFCHQHDLHFISDEVYALSGFSSCHTPDPVPFVSALSLDVGAIGCDPSRVHVIWSTSKDLGSSGFRMGCCVTQANRALQVGMALAANTQMSSLTAIVTTTLLNSPEFPSLLKVNANRLAEAYETLTSFFHAQNIEFIPVSHGPFVFARIAPEAVTWDDEALAIACCKQSGVVISAGKAYHIIDSEKGWARLTFAIPGDDLVEAIRRLDAGIRLFRSRFLADGLGH